MGGIWKSVGRSFFSDESGATAIEYCFIAGGIAVAIVAATQLLGTNLTSAFNAVAAKLN